MFIFDAMSEAMAFFCVMLLCGWVWRRWLRKNDAEGYRKQMGRDAFVKKHGMAIGEHLLKKWMK